MTKLILMLVTIIVSGCLDQKPETKSTTKTKLWESMSTTATSSEVRPKCPKFVELRKGYAEHIMLVRPKSIDSILYVQDNETIINVAGQTYGIRENMESVLQKIDCD